MVRNHRETKQLAPAIQRPRFPHLKPISALEILQYEIGREELANRLNKIYPKFKTCFDNAIKKKFKPESEPWQVALVYWSALQRIAHDEDLFVNIPEFFFEGKKLQVARVHEADEFCGFGIGWIRKIDANYRAWFKFILRRMVQFGCSTSWDYLHCDSIIEFEEEQMMDSDTEEERARFAESIEQIKIECAEEERKSKMINLQAKKPSRLKKPKGKREKEIVAAIKAGLEFVKAVDDSGKRMNDFFNEEAASEYGTLTPHEFFFIMDSWLNPSDVITTHVLEWHIDDRANNVGIAPFELEVPEDQEYHSDLFDFTPINTLFAFHIHFHKLEQTFERL